jgi:hypothetical protein
MGFQSKNLIDVPEIFNYAGAIFSPINSDQDAMAEEIEAVTKSRPSNFDVVFDPQLYVPTTAKSSLKDWSYFPKDLGTADISSTGWLKLWSLSSSSNLRCASGARQGSVSRGLCGGFNAGHLRSVGEEIKR